MTRDEPMRNDHTSEAPIVKCMRFGCFHERWVHPDGWRSALCKEHTEEVIRGERRAPPLRVNIDYQSSPRKSFLVDVVGSGEKKP